AKDLRVIIIKFADRLHNMSTINHLPLIKQRRIAIETRDVYAPLAHRLGMNKLKMELEDLILQVLDPDEFYKLEKNIKATKKQRESYIKEFSAPVIEELKNYQIEAEVFGRAKHFYSIYGKMKRRNKKFEELFDLFAIRIIVDKISECYAVLGSVHQLYTPLQERFKDYVATPKSNGYQSIHTTVFGKHGKMVEVQIRTKEMDRLAEVGVAAHWIYKESGNEATAVKEIDKHISWLRELVEILQTEDSNPDEFLKLLKVDLFQNEIFVFTPQGDVVQLPAESTPVDFAFSVHTQVGLHCIGAKINSKIVPLNTPLQNGDAIEVITSESQTPSYAWLKFVQSSKAKSHIKRWVKKEQFEQSIQLGKEIVEKTLRRLKKLYILDELKARPQTMGLNNEDKLYSEVASGQITVRELVEKYEPNVSDGEPTALDSPSLTERFINRARGVAKGVKVDGVSNTLIVFAKCCSPIPGDAILGYITRGRGVTIHRNTCNNLPSLQNEDRFINVEWEVAAKTSFIVRMKIITEDRKNILRDITESIAAMSMNIKSIDMRSEEGMGSCILILETRDTRQLARLKKQIQKIPNVIDIERI
ncbi:MAG: bifunctional (p)ppGpp synthetase/guanosine-3',5'-bis(diphosphate) 3'-pyrophosphohydrolase, partial [Candidatus Marinimicrobia bacterium]|nr:bifunctional (p)ppGpp synthetase/guanosine-3',5'-bis(diphosphate) 3'-pyrophosphohydrolase [Candidatus Neomarinimicrobiota bacterium]